MDDVAVDPLAFAPFTRARRVRAELVAGILRSGRVVPDDTFDEIYPDAVRQASPGHWTPIRVCARIVELLRLAPGDRLVDVGAGAGKFCIVAAAMSRACVRGIESCPRFAAIAREASRRLKIEVEITSGAFDGEEAANVDAAYLFNPDVTAAEAFSRKARVGTRIVTFGGFGGTIPADYERLAEETWDGSVLELWVKRAIET